MMKLSTTSLALAFGILWGCGVGFVALAHLVFPSYGTSFLEVVGSIYPGFHAARNIGDAMIGTGYALLDGTVGGFVFGWLYNMFVERKL
jgi:hypothetical protein